MASTHLEPVLVEAVALVRPAVPHPSAALNACQLARRHLGLRAGHGVRGGPLAVNDAGGGGGGVQGHEDRQAGVSEILMGNKGRGGSGGRRRKGEARLEGG